jgi:ABC-type multidrug transport system fused ATPase/permease subunit
MELGINAFFGLIILVVVIPINYALTKLNSRLQVL